MAEFLFEIGTEELPPFSIKPSVLKLKEEFENLFKEAKIEYGEIKYFATPRRIGILITNLKEKQKEYEEEIKGPPYHFAFNEKGEKKEAFQKFLESYNIKENSIEIREEKGRKYIYARIKKGGRSTKEIIRENIWEILKRIPFKKRMNWGIKGFTFARPIRWILSLWNDEIFDLFLPFKTGNKTRGNRLFGNTEIEITRISDYEKLLKENGVIPKWEERRKIIEEKIEKICKKIKGISEVEEEQIEELTGLVEYPGVILCEYPEKYLSLPKEIIFTAMKSHQRYIPLTSQEGKVMPYFIAVINNKEEKKDTIKKGLEEVLIARLEDAKFYIERDTEIPLEERTRFLKEIVWIKGLGSIYDKNQRVKKISEYLISDSNLKVDKKLILKVIDLIRTDLTTEMVRDGKEFTELEGIIASEYAKIQKKEEKIVKILREYRLPRFLDDSLPETDEAKVISLSDKIDTICALLASGYRIKGSKDPMGLKRLLYSLFYLIISKEIKTDIEKLINFSLEELKKQNIKIKAEKEKILEELLKKFENFLEEFKNIRYDIVDAVIESKVKDLFIIYKKASVLQKHLEKERETFEKIIIGQKRVFNIIKTEKTDRKIDIDLFEKEEERTLFEKVKEIEPIFTKKLEEENFEEALKELLKLREPIDRFFDNVFVMTEKLEIRKNRLNLLKKVWDVFRKYGNLSKIVL